MNPHDRNEVGTIEKKHNRKEANNMVNTEHINMAWCSTKYDAWQGYMKLLMARDDAYKATHQSKFKWGWKQHIPIPVSPPYANFEIGPDLNKPYYQVVKQQVKMHQDDLHEIPFKLHIEFVEDINPRITRQEGPSYS